MSRLEKLKELEADLRELMRKAPSRTYASLARQYRETLREIDELEDDKDDGDEIAQILDDRDADGRAGAVRESRARL